MYKMPPQRLKLQISGAKINKKTDREDFEAPPWSCRQTAGSACRQAAGSAWRLVSHRHTLHYATTVLVLVPRTWRPANTNYLLLLILPSIDVRGLTNSLSSRVVGVQEEGARCLRALGQSWEHSVQRPDHAVYNSITITKYRSPSSMNTDSDRFDISDFLWSDSRFLHALQMFFTWFLRVKKIIFFAQQFF
jgi:hypothetical protein